MIAYLIERGRPSVFLPAAIGIGLAANVGDGLHVQRVLSGTGLACLLIAQFRLWDDLADIEIDRLRYPERVLCRAAHVERFVLGGLLLGAANIAVAGWLAGAAGVVMLIVIDAAIAVWYTVRPRHRRWIGDLVLLGKYPALVLIVSGSSSPTISQIAAAIAVYIAACLVEIWHDASSPLRFRVSA